MVTLTERLGLFFLGAAAILVGVAVLAGRGSPAGRALLLWATFSGVFGLILIINAGVER